MEAATPASDGPLLTLIDTQIRGHRERLEHIIQMEQSGEILNPEQLDVVRSKPKIKAIIDELEKLRAPLSDTLLQECSPLKKLRYMNLMSFGSFFGLNNESELESLRHNTTLERQRFLNSVVSDYGPDMLTESDLDMISTLKGLMVPKSVNSELELDLCLKHADLWLANADQPIHLETNVTYATLKAKLNMIMSSGYFTATPQVRGAGEGEVVAAGQVPTQESVEEQPSTETADDNQGASPGPPTPTRDYLRALTTSLSIPKSPTIPAVLHVSNKLFDYSVDPSRFASVDWSTSLTKLTEGVPGKAWEAWKKKFLAWEAFLASTTLPPSSTAGKHHVFGMKKLIDASPESFVSTTRYQGHDLRVFTRDGVKLIRGLLLWMNTNIHRFCFGPDLTTKTAKSCVYYDDVGLVFDLAPRVVYEEPKPKPIGILRFRQIFEYDIRMLIELIVEVCGGKDKLPIMTGHLFEVMKSLRSWVDNFDYIKNHPVFWTAAQQDSFCQVMKNELWELKPSAASLLTGELNQLICGEEDWWAYVSQTICLLDESETFEKVLLYSLKLRLEKNTNECEFVPKPIELPICAKAYPNVGYFGGKVGIMYWIRELYSHLDPDPRETRHQKVFNGVNLLFPVYFCQLSWFLFKLGQRAWLLLD